MLRKSLRYIAYLVSLLLVLGASLFLVAQMKYKGLAEMTTADPASLSSGRLVYDR